MASEFLGSVGSIESPAMRTMSHVIKAMSYSDDEANEAIRLAGEEGSGE